MRTTNILTDLLILSTTIPSTLALRGAANKKSDSILLSNVRTLTLREGQKTSARRVTAIPQLTCIGGNAKGLYDVDVMRCKNSGSEYDPEDVQWTCQASLPAEFKLGSTDVICEGYDSPEDAHVLKGSCGVEYRLVLTDAGEEKYGTSSYGKMSGVSSGQSIGNAFFSVLFWGCFIGVIAVMLYRVLFPHNDAGRNIRDGFRQNYFGGGGGGGGDDGHDDPPPAYSPRAPKPASAHRANRSAGPTQGQRSDGAWRPGFWTGTAAGAAAGYAASALGGGGRNARSQQRTYGYDPQPQAGPSNWFGRTRDPSPPRTASWFGGGDSGGYGGGFGSAGASSSMPSSSRHESTGFGGTRRR